MARKKQDKPDRKRATVQRVQASEDKPFVLPGPEVKPEAEEGPPGDDGLTMRQRLFVEAVTGPALGQPAEAARIAGYSDSNTNVLYATASRLLTVVKVQEAVAHALAAKRLTPDWAIRAVAARAGAGMDKFMSVGPDGKPEVDWAKAAAAGAIAQVREYREEGFEHGGTVTVIKRSLKVHDSYPAVQTLLKLHGLLVDKVEDVTPPPSPVGRLLANPRAFRAARELAAALNDDADADSAANN